MKRTADRTSVLSSDDLDAGVVSVLCVTYNSANDVVLALESAVVAVTAAGRQVELIVVDNASRDLSVETVARRFPEARLVRNAVNVGFGAAMNEALALAYGTTALQINPDAVLDAEAARRMLDFIDSHPRAGAGGSARDRAGTRTESAGMSPGLRSVAGHFLFLNRLLPGDRGGLWRGIQVRQRPGSRPQRVDWVGAMAALYRTEALRQVRAFNVRFFLYGEDVDLGERSASQGWESRVLPSAHAIHAIAGSEGHVSTRWVDALHELCRARSGRMRLLVFDAIMTVGLTLGLRTVRRGG